MKLNSIHHRLGGCTAALYLAAALTSTHAAISVDGSRDAVGEAEYTERAVQVTATNWGASNSIANLHSAQDGSDLAVFIGGRAQGNAILLFIDSKAGGSPFIPNNLITSGGEEYTINSLGSTTTAGLTFETGFSPDFAIRIYGAATEAHVNRYDLQAGSRAYVGQTVAAIVAASGFVREISTVWADVSAPFADVTNGVEMKLSLASLGVPNGAAQPIKLMAVLVNDNSSYASNQVLASRTSSTADIGGGIKTINFETEASIQTVSLTVNNTDTDGDGQNNDVDTDDDGDGLLDTVENDTGIFVSASATGTDPLIADSDGDGAEDGEEVTGDPFGLGAGNMSNPNFANYNSIAVAGSFNTPAAWDVAGGSGNLATRVGAGPTTQYDWKLDYKLPTIGEIQYKFAANGSYSTSWGDATPSGNMVSTVQATGFHTFAFNNATLVRSLTRTVFADSAAFRAAYGNLEAGVDNDNDGILNENEFTANTDPTNNDTDGDGLLDNVDPNPLVPVAQSRNVVFKVDMSVQQALGNFNPATGAVVVKIFSGVMAGSPDLPMTDANQDGVFETTPVPVPGLAGFNFGEFKFFNSTANAPNSGYEELPANRNFVIGANGVAQTVPDPVEFFSNNSTMPEGYASWAGASGYNLAPNDGRTDDPDNDGFTNLQEFLFGSAPNAATASLVTTTPATDSIVLTWLQRDTGASYSLVENTDLATWLPSAVVPVVSGDQTGVPTGYTRLEAILPTTPDPKKFLRVKGEE